MNILTRKLPYLNLLYEDKLNTSSNLTANEFPTNTAMNVEARYVSPLKQQIKVSFHIKFANENLLCNLSFYFKFNRRTDMKFQKHFRE